MTETSPRTSPATYAAVVLAAVAAILLVLYAWDLPPFRSAIESTENAYVRGSVTVIAPMVDGYVVTVLVQDFQSVQAGEVLVKLDAAAYLQKLGQARAVLAVREADLANFTQARRAREAGIENAKASVLSAEAQLAGGQAQLLRNGADQQRVEALVADGSISLRERDLTTASLRQAEAVELQAHAATLQARAGYTVARQELATVIVNRRVIAANLESARAAVRLAEIDLDNTNVRAPQAGTVGEVGVKLGQYATPGAQLMALVPSKIWVIANFKEAQIRHMSPGQAALVQVDALGAAQFNGHVESMSPATGSEFSVIRADNATGNFTKIAQRLPVRIVLDVRGVTAARLRPGLSATVKVDTGPEPR